MKYRRKFYLAMKDKADELMAETFQKLASQDDDYQRACLNLKLAKKKYQEMDLTAGQRKIIEEIFEWQYSLDNDLASLAYLSGVEDSKKILEPEERFTLDYDDELQVFKYSRKS